MTAISMSDLVAAFEDVNLTQYHESGHAVVDYLNGFRPKRITGALAEHDRRTTSFFRSGYGFLSTPLAREKAQSFAVGCIAGIAAESKVSGTPLRDLRYTSGVGDYEKVHAIVERLSLHRPLEFSNEVSEAYIRLWEARAVALMNQTMVWSAVESLASELCDCEGGMQGTAIVSAIQYGMKNHKNA